MRATHYSPDNTSHGAACGVFADFFTPDPKKVDCINCRSTRQFPGKRIKSLMKAAHEMAAAGGYGFLGTTGMKSYHERLSMALTHLGRQR